MKQVCIADHKKGRLAQTLALVCAAALTSTMIPCAAAAGTIGDGVTASCDEAYYATLDYYGNLTNGSVVKSYTLNGADSLTDYGAYDSVVNLTDDTKPVASGGQTTFRFGDHIPDHFCFEGVTTQPFDTLPWTLSMSYTLNGVPTKAEDLAGQTGVVEIKIDAVPNANADDYAKNNYTLEAMAVFNQNDILSLEAEGAQVQLVGNLRIVLFLAMPGEEQHFVIRVGSDDFSFDGMTFLMVPATLSQLSAISELSDKKDELEDNYNKLSDSLDTMLDAVGNMSGSLNAAASGLDELNQARGTISAGKGQVYEDLDVSLGDLTALTEDLEPVQAHLKTASAALTSINSDVNTLVSQATSLKKELADTETDITRLQGDLSDLRNSSTNGSLSDLQGDLNLLGSRISALQSTLRTMRSTVSALNAQAGNLTGDTQVTVNGKTVSEIRQAEAQVKQLHTAYETGSYEAAGVDFQTFMTGYFTQQGMDAATAAANASALNSLWQQISADPSGFDAQLEQADSVNTLLTAFNMNVTQMKALSEALGPDTVTLLDQLDALCESLGSNGISGSLSGLVNITDSTLSHLSDLSGTLSSASAKTRTALDDLDKLNTTVNSYIPEAQQALTDSQKLAADGQTGLKSLNTFLTDLEALAKKSGTQLDSGTQKTLAGLAATLRETARSVSTTGEVKSAKDSISSVIEDTWNEYTGEKSNLLNMDADAEAVSLTSQENPAPSSVQVLIRTQEIKVAEEDSAEKAEKAADTGTFWNRLVAMFKGIGSDIAGLFKH